MPRLTAALPKLRTLTPTNLQQARLLSITRPLSNPSDQHSAPATTDDKPSTRAQDSTPGWGGREGRDHAVNRPAHDVQADTAQQAMKDHEQGKEGSAAISRKDENNNQQKTKEEFPEAPVVIGMNDERGSKDH